MDKKTLVNLLNTVYFIGLLHGGKDIMLPEADRIRYFESLINILGENFNA